MLWGRCPASQCIQDGGSLNAVTALTSITNSGRNTSKIRWRRTGINPKQRCKDVTRNACVFRYQQLPSVAFLTRIINTDAFSLYASPYNFTQFAFAKLTFPQIVHSAADLDLNLHIISLVP